MKGKDDIVSGIIKDLDLFHHYRGTQIHKKCRVMCDHRNSRWNTHSYLSVKCQQSYYIRELQKYSIIFVASYRCI